MNKKLLWHLVLLLTLSLTFGCQSTNHEHQEQFNKQEVAALKAMAKNKPKQQLTGAELKVLQDFAQKILKLKNSDQALDSFFVILAKQVERMQKTEALKSKVSALYSDYIDTVLFAVGNHGSSSFAKRDEKIKKLKSFDLSKLQMLTDEYQKATGKEIQLAQAVRARKNELTVGSGPFAKNNGYNALLQFEVTISKVKNLDAAKLQTAVKKVVGDDVFDAVKVK